VRVARAEEMEGGSDLRLTSRKSRIDEVRVEPDSGRPMWFLVGSWGLFP